MLQNGLDVSRNSRLFQNVLDCSKMSQNDRSGKKLMQYIANCCQISYIILKNWSRSPEIGGLKLEVWKFTWTDNPQGKAGQGNRCPILPIHPSPFQIHPDGSQTPPKPLNSLKPTVSCLLPPAFGHRPVFYKTSSPSGPLPCTYLNIKKIHLTLILISRAREPLSHTAFCCLFSL